MDYQELIERMRAFNDWRRGGDFEMPHPMQIGMDIDAMCDAIESLLAENERLKAELAKYRDAPVVAWRYKMIPPGWTYSDQEPNRDFFGDAWNRIQVSALIVKPVETK